MLFPRLPAGLGLSLNLVAATTACSSQSGPTPPQGTGAHLVEVASGLSSPLYLTAPPGNATRLFVVEQTGAIRVIASGTLLPTPFLDISGRISSGGEQGLLGLAFDPNYASTGRFFVHYTDPSGDTRVSGFQVSANPDVADGGSEQVILAAPQPYSNHNGGQLVFGPDGMLYLGLGDGGASGDPQGRQKSGATAFAIPGASASTAEPGTCTSLTWGRHDSRKLMSRQLRREGGRAQITAGIGWKETTASTAANAIAPD